MPRALAKCPHPEPRVQNYLTHVPLQKTLQKKIRVPIQIAKQEYKKVASLNPLEAC